MKILIISDKITSALYEHIQVENFKDVDLILSAGDLPARYLSFITTILKKPLIYVHGNHDHHYQEAPPDGCINIDGKVMEFQGLRILGLGGCMEYRGGLHQYTEKQMVRRVRRIKRSLKGGFDILLTHSPAFELGDGKDTAHIGFKVFRNLLEDFRPPWMIHGHQHLNYGNTHRIISYQDTTIINAYEYYILEI